MPTDFSQLYSWLDTVEQRVTRGAHQGLSTGADVVAQAAQQTSVYNDDTGATRASTVAVVISTIDDGSGKLSAAESAADAHNPGHGQNNVAISSSADRVVVALTSQTDYAGFLETTHAGRNAFIQPTMQQFQGQLGQYAANGVKQEIEA
jgi:hypothetical protein